MKTNIHETGPLGELVVAALDEAAKYGAEPREVSLLATSAVMRMFHRLLAKRLGDEGRAADGLSAADTAGTNTLDALVVSSGRADHQVVIGDRQGSAGRFGGGAHFSPRDFLCEGDFLAVLEP